MFEILDHMLVLIFLIGPILFMVFKIIKSNGYKSDVKHQVNFRTLFYLALSYALSFNIDFLLQEIFLVLGKKSIGLTSYLYHNNHTWEGDSQLAQLMQGTGALGIFITGIIFYFLYNYLKNQGRNPFFKYFILLLAFQCFIQAIPQLQTASLATNTDVGQAISYLNLIPILNFCLTLISTALIILIVYKFYLEIISMRLFVIGNHKSRLIGIALFVVLPTIVGCILIIPFRIMPWHRALYPFMSALMWLPWLLTFSLLNDKKKIKLSKNMNFSSSKPISVSLVGYFILLFIFQIVLANGIKF